MEQKKIDSLLRQIQSKLSYLRKLETVSPSSFNNYKTPITSSIHNEDVIFFDFPLKKNIKSLENCFSNVVIQLWWKYYKISYRLNMNNIHEFTEKSSTTTNPNDGRYHILSLRELASCKLAESISNYIEESSHNLLEEEEEDNIVNNNKDQNLFSLIPDYIPCYLTK